MGSLAKFEENVDPFLRAHFGSGKRVCGVRVLEGVEDSNHFLHRFYLTLIAGAEEFRCGSPERGIFHTCAVVCGLRGLQLTRWNARVRL